ncbi:MAG: peptidoglycan DD-metalloendopeptidase family protein [Acidobacteria bacterium]|nr:peptidoglycan DD-metalloendopeptidase family protein [Acidobacteriota bacterium]
MRPYQWLAVILVLSFVAGLSRWWMEHRVTSPEAVNVSTEDALLLPLSQFRSVDGYFEKNQTVTHVLLAEGLSIETVHEIINAAKPVYNLAKVHVGRLYQLHFTEDGKFHDFRYYVDEDRYLTVSHDTENGGYIPAMENHPFETRVERISASIDSSLFAAVAELGERQGVAVEISDIFGSDIDFNTDVQKGDSFQALIEKKYLDGEFSKNGVILAASFSNGGKTLTGFRFEDENGKPAYYAPDGRALRRSFLKAPLKVIRITSRFSTARMHPIHKVVRPHLGVDYAAPTGTQVQAVGAGTVISAGWTSGGGGNAIYIRHAGGYETRYLHLSRILVKRGARVSQGDVIGHVGSTGDSTGPHLDFRVYKNGKAINPTTVVFPPGNPVANEKMAEFTELCRRLMVQLN